MNMHFLGIHINSILLTIFELQLHFSRPNTEEHPVVHTKFGAVRGNRHNIFNSSVCVFWSIPYAKPPLGRLRFQHPVAAGPWTGVLDGTQMPNACYQIRTEATWTLNVPESEDCLYLTVYVPSSSPIWSSDIATKAKNLPVMFYIYGGSFIRGTNTVERYNGSALAILNDVIVVTINYRLGSFGYLYSQSPEAPGNAGSLDQLMALKWTYDHIDSFGGDPQAITIMGVSAGSISVGHLILSPLSGDLFSRAILMSGAPNSFVGTQTVLSSFRTIKTLGKLTGYNDTYNASIAEIVAWLRDIPAVELDLAQDSFQEWYGPVTDHYFILKAGNDVYEEAVKKNITVVLGVTENEGEPFLIELASPSDQENIDLDMVYWLVINSIQKLTSTTYSSHQLEVIRYAYTNWNDINDYNAKRQIISNLIGDLSMVCPTSEFGHQLADRNLNVYYYVFNHRSSKSIFPRWVGVGHGEDIEFVMGRPLDTNNSYTEKEYNVSYTLVKSLGNFAKYGVPFLENVKWPTYSRSHQSYVEINTWGNDFKKGPRAFHCALWNTIIPNLTSKNCN